MIPQTVIDTLTAADLNNNEMVRMVRAAAEDINMNLQATANGERNRGNLSHWLFTNTDEQIAAKSADDLRMALEDAGCDDDDLDAATEAAVAYLAAAITPW